MDDDGHSQFVAEYRAEVVDLPPAPDYSFSAPGAGARAIVVGVEPWGKPPWTGTFAAPEPGCRTLTALLRTPSLTGLCVVERGTAFRGDVDRPHSFEVVPTTGPVVASKALVDDATLLLLTPWAITAIEAAGVRWTTERLAIDGLQVGEASDGWVRVVADPDSDEHRDVSVNVATGEIIG